MPMLSANVPLAPYLNKDEKAGLVTEARLRFVQAVDGSSLKLHSGNRPLKTVQKMVKRGYAMSWTKEVGGAADALNKMLALHWFDFRSFTDLINRDMVEFGRELVAEGILRLPYDECVFLLPQRSKDGEDFLLALHLRQNGNAVATERCSIIYKQGKAWTLQISAQDLFEDDDIFFLLAAMSSNSATARERPVNSLEKPHKDGSFRGDTYTEVAIRRSSPSSCISGGGMHASPRLHWRRGHIRSLGDARRTWVRATLVGDAGLGTVIHDYGVSP